MKNKMRQILGKARSAVVVAMRGSCAWAGASQVTEFWYNTHLYELIVSTDGAVEAVDLCR